MIKKNVGSKIEDLSSEFKEIKLKRKKPNTTWNFKKEFFGLNELFFPTLKAVRGNYLGERFS